MFAFLAKKKRPLRCLVNKSGGSSLGASPPAPPSGILQGASQASRSFPGLQRASPASLPPPRSPLREPPGSLQGGSESFPGLQRASRASPPPPRSPLREPPGSLQGASESFPGLQRASRASPPSPPQEVNCVGATSSENTSFAQKGAAAALPGSPVCMPGCTHQSSPDSLFTVHLAGADGS